MLPDVFTGSPNDGSEVPGYQLRGDGQRFCSGCAAELPGSLREGT